MTRTGIWLFPSLEASRLVALAEEAERLGLDELWLGDEGPARDPFALLAAVAVRTERLRLGIAVTNPYLRLPAIAATSALTLQELSGGRFVLGFGTGGGYALDPLGVRPTTPAADTERALLTARAVASGEAFAGVAHAIPPGGLPLFVGSRGPRLNRFASRAADGAFVGGVPLGLLDRVLGWARSEREIETAVYLNVAFDSAMLERRRPDLLRVLQDSPPYVREYFGDDHEKLVDEYIVHGDVSGRVQELVARHRPTSIGISLLGADPFELLPRAAAVLTGVPV
ncbi:LLM class flavin-dependent oxidoreductase [Solirubrobacter soli]|uniref:LLM class flavin-dependent oxidoreductase n=1 Tax=Solirubrobacter soli TaxID=363832 RepID=UPI0004232D56|nr:LLM class flavin-dependent oxidoreductase [Solirubrobacter soli]